MSTGRLIGVLLAGALLTALLRWLWIDSGATPGVTGTASEPGAEQVITDLELRVLNADGSPHFELSTAQLVQSAGDGSAVLDGPTLVVHHANAAPWRATSKSAWLLEDGSEIRMDGDVRLERGEDLRISAESMTVFPYDDRARSDVETTVTEPGARITGVGMRADLVREFYQLLANVRGNYDPIEAL